MILLVQERALVRLGQAQRDQEDTYRQHGHVDRWGEQAAGDIHEVGAEQRRRTTEDQVGGVVPDRSAAVAVPGREQLEETMPTGPKNNPNPMASRLWPATALANEPALANR